MQVLDFMISTLIYGGLIALPMAIIWDVIFGDSLSTRKELPQVTEKDDEPVMATVKHQGSRRDSDRAMAIKIVAKPVIKIEGKLTIRKLKDAAKEMKLKKYSYMTKDQLIEALGVVA